MGHVKIFGERNSSTNALRLLIEKNSASIVAPSIIAEVSPSARRRLKLMRRFGLPPRWREAYIDSIFKKVDPPHFWKHCATNFPDLDPFSKFSIIICVRHPASWLSALHRRPYQPLVTIPDAFSDFLALEWRTFWRDRLDRATVTPIELYNLKIGSYIAFCGRLEQANIPFRISKFETFAVDQAEVFREISPILRDPIAKPKIIRRSTKDKAKNAAYYRNYYGNDQWAAEISRADMDHINAGVDWENASFFGYQPL